MNDRATPRGPAPGSYYQKELASDSRPVPPALKDVSPVNMPFDEIPVAHYTSREHYEREVDLLWKQTWQWACREEQIPHVGDTHVYEISRMSILIVRTAPDTIKAYHNVCLHRGRRLRDYGGNTEELRCSYHGFCWNLDGTFKSMPSPWDLPHIDCDRFDLPEVKVETWGGFVFINMNENAAPLAQTLGVIPEHFESWKLQDRCIIANVSKVMRCNWKVAQEGFQDSWHVGATHPQATASFGVITGQYDIFGPVSRTLTAQMAESLPFLGRRPSEQEKYDAMSMQYLTEAEPRKVPEGMRARTFAANEARHMLAQVVGQEVAHAYSDAELVDSIWYTVFPNMALWGGAGAKMQYRWRPYEDRHDMSVMDIIVIAPFSGERPAAVPNHFLRVDQPWTDAPELGGLGRFEDQDAFNLEAVQVGLNATVRKTVYLAKYQESRIRHFHHMASQLMGDTSPSVKDE